MIKIDKKKTAEYRYNEWLEYFSQIPAAELQVSQEELSRTLPSEGYAALARWLEIFENPSKMDKLSQGRIKAQREANIMDVAVGDDDEEFYKTLIKENVQQLENGSNSPQETARLSQNINIYRQQLQEIRSHRPKAGSTLERVLKAAEATKTKKVVKKKVTSKHTRLTNKASTKASTTKKSATKAKSQKKTPSKTPAKVSKVLKTIAESSGDKNG